MKLELKHLAPYLPYDLKWQQFWTDNQIHTDIMDVILIGNNCITFKNAPDHYLDGEGNECTSKPLLYPLSYLTKEIEHNGEKFVPIYEAVGSGKLRCEEIKIYGKAIQVTNIPDPNSHILDENGQVHPSCSIYIYQRFFEWHFDVFGLIEQNLAIDINTLKQDLPIPNTLY